MQPTAFIKPVLEETLVPELFYTTAAANSENPIAYILQGENHDAHEGMQTVSWSQFMTRATNAALAFGRFLPPRKLSDAPVVVGILGRNSCGNLQNIMAMMINRWAPLLLSPKNSSIGIAHLLNLVGAHHFFVEADFLPVVHAVQSSLPHITILVIEDCKPNGDETPDLNPYPASADEIKNAMHEPALFMHTSGSTDFPKAIPYTHRFLLSSAAYRRRDRLGEGSVVCTPSPVWHGLGMGLTFGAMPSVGDIYVFSTSRLPPTGEALLRLIHAFDRPHVVSPPSFIEEIYRTGPDAIADLASVKDLIVCGAALKQDVGDALVQKGVKVCVMYGSTEVGFGSRTTANETREDWAYIPLEGSYDYEMRPFLDDTFEFVVKAAPTRFPAIVNESNPAGYATSDLFTPHPTNPGLWKHAGRKDDITVLNNGLKTNNRQILDLLRQNPLISQAIVFGAGRLLNGVLIHPSASGAHATHFIDEIWPTIEHINEIIPRHSRLLRELVLQTHSSKPLWETDKGTIRTAHAIREYKDEIDQAYQQLQKWSEVPLPLRFDDQTVKDYVRDSVKAVLGHVKADGEVMFDYGLDSLHAIRLLAGCQALLNGATDHGMALDSSLPSNLIYQYPTINRLAAFLAERLGQSSTALAPDLEDTTVQEIERCIARFSGAWPTVLPDMHEGAAVSSQGDVYILTGTTGSLMSHVLALILEATPACKVYCLTRTASLSGFERHLKVFEAWGLDSALLHKNRLQLEFLDVDLSQGDLGLSPTKLGELRGSVSCVVHGAWNLNFNLTLESFERVHIAGVRHILDLCLSSVRTPKFYFLSSIAVCGKLNGPVPEETVHDPLAQLHQGYAQSKYVAEQLVTLAAAAGLRAAVIRLGQASGSTLNGAWNVAEHVPIMLQSSASLGIFPTDVPDVRWIPIDVAAEVLHDIVQSPLVGLSVFHIDNPDLTPWRRVSEAASRTTPGGLRSVTAQEWLAAVSRADAYELRVPATRLVGFFESYLHGKGLPQLDVSRSLALSKQVAYGPLSIDLLTGYVKYALSH